MMFSSLLKVSQMRTAATRKGFSQMLFWLTRLGRTVGWCEQGTAATTLMVGVYGHAYVPGMEAPAADYSDRLRRRTGASEALVSARLRPFRQKCT